MLTKIGKFFYSGNNDNSAIPTLAAANYGVFPWRTINSETELYFATYVRNKNFGSLLTAINNANSYGIALGSGTTPATENDYNMESLISSGLSVSFTSPASAYDSETEKCYTFINLTITNTGSNDLTIGELGIFCISRAASTKGGTPSTSTDYTVMVDHTTLDEPITIATGAAAVVQYRFEIDDSIVPPAV